MPEQRESARDAGIHTGAVALWGYQVGDARQNAARVVDALLVAGWQPPAPEPDGLTVERVAAAIKREGCTIAGFNTLNEWYVRFAKVAARAMMESPEWRGLSRDLLDAQRQLRGVYRERAQLVAVLAHFYPAVWAYSDPAEPEWPVVYVDTPAGQCGWHLHRDDLELFGHVDQVPADDRRARWDGHSTEEKCQRLAELSAMRRRTLSREQVATVLRHRLRDWHMDVPSSYRTSKFPYMADAVLELLRSAGIPVQEGGPQ